MSAAHYSVRRTVFIHAQQKNALLGRKQDKELHVIIMLQSGSEHVKQADLNTVWIIGI